MFFENKVSADHDAFRLASPWIPMNDANRRFAHMGPPIAPQTINNEEDRQDILSLIKNILPGKVEGFRIGAIYPTDNMNQDLVNIFKRVVMEAWSKYEQEQRALYNESSKLSEFNAVIEESITGKNATAETGTQAVKEFLARLASGILESDPAYKFIARISPRKLGYSV